MELHIDTEKLIRRLADALQQREERLLSELVARITKEPRPTTDFPTANDASEHREVKGIQPHALYSVSFVADRWNVSADNVRKKSEEELPRSDWKGGEIRYRGIDILRYEGVDVEKHISESSAKLETELATEFPESQQSNRRSSRSDGENGNGRPYNSELPALSDEDSPPD
ncbi:hypothetical protein [Salinibacter sp.]|uniref:hypothetical protein n=1 Tax=Salinibacter sp. TaxID=2065818 RepID=UPI0021E8BB72|nr:hypothetical protein [Salinibacter sp.]